MELKDAILKRRMVRNFADKPIPPELIERIVDLTRHAPSAGFTQGQAFIVVTQPELRNQQTPFFATQVMRVLAERLRAANQMLTPVEDI